MDKVDPRYVTTLIEACQVEGVKVSEFEYSFAGGATIKLKFHHDPPESPTEPVSTQVVGFDAKAKDDDEDEDNDDPGQMHQRLMRQPLPSLE